MKQFNWENINKKHQKAVKLFWKYKEKEASCFDKFFLEHQEFQLRDLYDFFDKQKILVTINWYYYEGKAYWAYRIFNLRRPDFKTRYEAEISAFEKAFELLEEKLNK